MRNWIRARLPRKIIFSVTGAVCLLMGLFAVVIVSERSRALEKLMFDKVRTDALVGARAAQDILEGLVTDGQLSIDDLFDTDYRHIESGPLAGSAIPKYHTRYDTLLDLRLRALEDSFLNDASVVFAVLVDRNGYLPTHNSTYSRPLTGDDAIDITGNRTKRLFNDPVGLRAARFTGENGDVVLRQVYHRDTGVTMWDVSAPVFVFGEHWGGFRIGLSMQNVEAQVAALVRFVVGSFCILSIVAALTIWWTVKGGTKRLDRLTRQIEAFSRDGNFGRLKITAPDEIGTLTAAFNHMLDSLDAVTVSRDYLDRILDSMNDSLMVVVADGTIRKANRASCRMLEYQPEELLGMSIEKIFAERSDTADSWFDHFIDSRDGEQVELEYRTRSGNLVPVLFSSAPLTGEDGEGDALICLAQDITERKIAEEKIRSGKRFLETVLDSLQEEMMILDANSLTILKANKAFVESCGENYESVVGQPCYKLTHGLDQPCDGIDHLCPVMEVFEFGKVEICEHLHRTPDGNIQYVEIQLTPVMDEAGEPRYLIHMARDITQRKRAEMELQHFAAELENNNLALAEKTAALEEAHSELKASQSRILQQEKMASIGQLSAGVAHEINNPIGFISSNLTTLGKYAGRIIGYLDEQERLWREKSRNEIGDELAALRKKLKIDYIVHDLKDLIDESLEGADRVKKIVLDLKGFSRVDDADCKEVDLHECLESTINIAWNEIKYKATLKKEFGDIPLLRCYPQQLNQVFMNLLVNAAHAIEDQGEITVRTWRDGEGIRVAISDTGRGISEQARERIFEPFFTTKEVGKGTGLGLSISYDIIKKHHGEISVESRLGEGTTFTIFLPLQSKEVLAC
ncbi:hypothetical protein C2E25_09705 [Geothermobacter hydrogeniphilus]|uniref:histidine kinase n=1 Tax=Geothermobacter hydrogeniphilus TaxID=1969733 RepID=A0A2K2H9F6_9BACT|nr:PAS domain-containing protein [Geothermobacter hydrogeniphilus]PNU19936.1 hypothetical protein C2E25_09705 [Geothermobacter hydrogeniphilus]